MTRNLKIITLCFILLFIFLISIEYNRTKSFKVTMNDLQSKVDYLEEINTQYKDTIEELTKDSDIKDDLEKDKNNEDIQVPEITDIRNNYIEFVKSNLNLKLTNVEVEKLLGNNYKIIYPADGAVVDIMWRYDMLCVDNYRYDEEMDFVDIDGLVNNDIGLIMFIYFSDDAVVKGFTLYYVGTEVDSVYEYRLYGQQEKETRIK